MNTPGPWTHKRWDNDMGEIFAADGTCIAYVRYNGQPDDPESVAIGSLIAAAPDLKAFAVAALKALEEAREMLGVFEDNGGHDGLGGKGYLATIDHMDEAKQLGRAAVVKAEEG